MRGIWRSRWVKVALSVLLTVLLFSYFYRTIDLGEFLASVREASWGFVLLGALMYCMTYPLRAFRIYYLTRHAGNAGFGKTQAITFRHQFYGRIIPFKVGDLSLVYLLRSYADVPLPQGSAVLVLLRVFDAFVIILSFLLCNISVSMRLFSNWILVAVLAALAAVLLCAPFAITRAADWIRKRGIYRRRAVRRLVDAVLNVRDMLVHSVASPKNFAVIGLSSALLWLFVYLSMYFVIAAFGQQVTLAETVVASFLASAAAFLPINGIGGFGAVETGWAVGFTLLGVARPVALASGVVSNMMSFVVICVFGLVSYLGGLKRVSDNHIEQ